MKGLVNWRVRNIAVLLAAVWVLGSTAFGAPTPLSNGVAVNNLSGIAGSQMFYTIEVPAGQDDLEIKISGGTGDCDLYVRRNVAPTITAYDYRPYEVGNNETVAIESPAAGTWYIMLRGYTAYSGLTLKATYSASLTVTELSNGVPLTGLSATIGTETYYKIEVPAGQTKLEIQISGGTGDCDLYVKQGALPTAAIYDYRPYLVGNNEIVTVDNPVEGTWYIMLRAYSTYSGTSLLATYSGGIGVALQNGVPVPNLSGAAGSEVLYRIDVPAGQTNLEISISGGTGDADLYVKFGTPPTVSDFDYRPFTPGNDETVTIANPAAGAWYIMVRGYNSYAGLTLVATYGNVVTLQNGVPITNLAGALASEKMFKIDVPSGETEFDISISGGTGNADLYIRRGLPPTISDWDYRPYLPGNSETVSLSNPQAGTWYIMVRARQAYTGLTLLAEHAFVGNVTLLSNGVPVPNTSGVEGSKKYYRIIVPSNQSELEIQISGGTGDADLYVNFGDQVPTLTNYDYRPYEIGNNETVTISNPPSGNYLIMVHAYHAYTGLTVVATYTGGGGGQPSATPLSNGVPVPGLTGGVDSQTFFRIDVPAGQSTLDIEMFGGTGDADLYVRKDQPPTLSEWDYRPFLLGNDETVTINTPAAGTYYIMLNAYQAYSGVTLVATYVPIAEPVTELYNGIPETGLSGADDSETFFKIIVPAGQDFLDIEMSGGTGDADLYVRKGSKPTPTSWDYRPYLIGNNEAVHIDDPAAATWYIMIKAYQAYSGVTLVATYGTEVVGNNFAVDPNCVALWRFEPNQLTKDGIDMNKLTNHGVDVNTVEFREGIGAATFNAKETDYFTIPDANLSADFPLKSTGTHKTISLALWFRPQSLPLLQTLWSKYDRVNSKISFALVIGNYNGVRYFAIRHGSPSGGSYVEAPLTALPLVADQWYHVAVTYDDSDRSYRIRVYDAATDTVFDTTGNFHSSMFIGDARVTIGSRSESDWPADGVMDECVVFNDVLTPGEIDKIRQGTYGKP